MLVTLRAKKPMADLKLHLYKRCLIIDESDMHDLVCLKSVYFHLRFLCKSDLRISCL